MKKLKALTQSDEALLCGRENAVRALVDSCLAERFTVVTAEPGLGITSFFEAGAAPALRREGFIAVVFSDWQDRSFAANLKEAVADAVRQQSDPPFYAQGEDLDDLLERARSRTGRPVVLLLDQFEDYLRCHVNTIPSDLFEAELARAITARKGICVAGLQVHAIPAFERLGPHIPNLLGYRMEISPLSVDEARAAVLAEARAAGFEVEPAALDALVSAPVVEAGQNQVHPFFLKVATGRLFEGEAQTKSTALRASTIEARGGVDRVVLESLDAALAPLGSTHADLFFRWCQLLISPKKHRLSVTEKGLTEYAGKFNRFVPALLGNLTESGVLRSVQTPAATRYEIARDCYTPIVRDWWERRESMIVARRRAAFRMRSISVAIGALVFTYVIWLFFGAK